MVARQRTGLAQPNVSRQLRGLHARGVVSRRKAGNQVYYKVTDGTVVELCRSACIRIASQIDEQRSLKKALLKFMPSSGTAHMHQILFEKPFDYDTIRKSTRASATVLPRSSKE